MKNSKKLLFLTLLATSFINFKMSAMERFSNSPKTRNDDTITLVKDVTWQETTIFKGDCTIEGYGFNLSFAPEASITVAENSTLCLKNITIKNIDQKIKLAANSSKIILMNNVTWEIKSYFTFNVGSFILQNSVFTIRSTNPPQTGFFIYKTTEKSILQSNSVLKFENASFGYCPTNHQNNLIEAKKKSYMHLINSKFFLGEKLQLLKCGLIVEGFFELIAKKECALMLGDGVQKENNAQITPLPDAQISVKSGELHNNNVE